MHSKYMRFSVEICFFFGKTIEQFFLKVLLFIDACVDVNDLLIFICYHIDLIENGGD